MSTVLANSAPVETARNLSRLSTMRSRVLAVVLLTMLPAFATIIFNAADERARAIEFSRASALSTVRLIATQQSQLIASTEQVLRLVAGTQQIVNSNRSTCASFLQQVYSTIEGYRGLSVADANGDVYCAAGSTPLTGTLNTSDRSYFKKVMATKDFAIGDFQVGAVSGTPNISFGYPVLDAEQRVTGVVWTAWNVERLNDLVSGWGLPQGTSVILMDSQGTVIMRYPNWAEWVGRQFKDSPLFSRMASLAEGTERLIGLDDVPRWFAFTTVSASNALGSGTASGSGSATGSEASRAGNSILHVAAGYSDAVFMQGVNNRLLVNLATLTLLSVVGLVVAYGMTDWMIGRRARRMMQTTRELQQGNWAARTNMTDTDGELGELGRTVDEMADALQQRDLALQTINAELEERVVFRTTELAEANGQLEASQDRLRRLSRDLLNLAEQERIRVANDVSDELGQGLTGIKMNVVLARRQLASGNHGGAAGHLDAAVRTLDSVVQTTRQIASSLRPSVLDDFGLTAAVEGQLGEFKRQTGIDTKLDAVVDETHLSKAAGTAAFRVLQEALTNVAIHAHATKVRVTVRTEDSRLSMVIQDDGQGFRPSDLLKPQAMGVLGMRERAMQLGGALSVAATPNEGTILHLTVPIIDGKTAGANRND